MYRIGIDIGGTNIKAGVVDENYNIVESTFGPTKAGRPANEIVMDACMVAESAMNLCFVRKEDCAGVGISCAGTCAPKDGKVLRADNLGFNDVPVCDLVSFKFGLPAKLANDADAAALGEMVAGAAKGHDSVLYICIGTGVRVGLVLDGKIYSGYGGVEFALNAIPEIANLINIFDPEIVVIGGGISKEGENLLSPLREYVADHIFGGRRRTPPKIVSAVLGDSAGVIGAAAMIE